MCVYTCVYLSIDIYIYIYIYIQGHRSRPESFQAEWMYVVSKTSISPASLFYLCIRCSV